ncbi:MAG: ADP-forming succinate--CoA ligase subunit beta [Deltaproteobacteria bacterium]|nr:ADP-forming succinate--CoA ligase subunit beta [Deltaproteobacteria bacterium]
MKLHEHQGKELFRKAGVPVPLGRVAFNVDEAEAAARALIAETGVETVVVKAQIHAGGRGKGGGVKVVQGAAAAREAAQRILGMNLVTHQTGSEGKVVRRLLVEQGLRVAKELYAGIVVDRDRRRVVMMVSSEGGMEIEEVARRTPEKILSRAIDPAYGLRGFEARELAFGLGLGEPTAGKLARVLGALYKVFVAEDCSLVEINPFVVLESGDVVALDAKVTLDDNAAYRHKEHPTLADPSEEDPAEAAARAAGFSYIRMHGDIGCMVNGAGLAMATMDILKHHGGEPANFLDVGGGASKDQVAQAFKVILSDPAVKAIFVNIFGGILKCDVLAEGVIAAVREAGLKVPLVVRLEGTNVARGRQLLGESGLAIQVAKDMDEGAKKAVALAGDTEP